MPIFPFRSYVYSVVTIDTMRRVAALPNIYKKTIIFIHLKNVLEIVIPSQKYEHNCTYIIQNVLSYSMYSTRIQYSRFVELWCALLICVRTTDITSLLSCRSASGHSTPTCTRAGPGKSPLPFLQFVASRAPGLRWLFRAPRRRTAPPLRRRGGRLQLRG